MFRHSIMWTWFQMHFEIEIQFAADFCETFVRPRKRRVHDYSFKKRSLEIKTLLSKTYTS